MHVSKNPCMNAKFDIAPVCWVGKVKSVMEITVATRMDYKAFCVLGFNSSTQYVKRSGLHKKGCRVEISVPDVWCKFFQCVVCETWSFSSM